MEDLEEKDESEDRVVKKKELEGEIDEPKKERPNEGEFVQRPGKERMVEEATKHSLPALLPSEVKEGLARDEKSAIS